MQTENVTLEHKLTEALAQLLAAKQGEEAARLHDKNQLRALPGPPPLLSCLVEC